MKRLALVAVLLSACTPTARPATPPPPAPSPHESLALTFAWVGGCREDFKHWDAAKNPSSANVAELEQTLTDLSKLAPVPRYFFFAGDLVLGLSDTPTLEGQLKGWSTLYAHDPSGIASKTTLVPIMGNHESLVYRGKDERMNPAAGPAFSAWLTASGFDAHAGNGPTNAPPNLNALGDDERKLTYSFDDGPVHFVVLNTDSWTTTAEADAGTTEIGWVPYHWLAQDLAAAEARPATRAVFVFGHKPLFRPDRETARGDVINAAMNDAIARLFDASPKVKAYLTSHDHLWDMERTPGPRGVWQIIAGNGGSELDKKWKQSPPYFGFSVVRVYDSGRVGLVPYRRPVPNPYDGPALGPAAPQDEITVAP